MKSAHTRNELLVVLAGRSLTSVLNVGTHDTNSNIDSAALKTTSTPLITTEQRTTTPLRCSTWSLEVNSQFDRDFRCGHRANATTHSMGYMNIINDQIRRSRSIHL